MGVLFSLLDLGILCFNQGSMPWKTMKPLGIVFLIGFILLFVGMCSSVTVVFINVLVFILGVLKNLEESKKRSFRSFKLWFVNYYSFNYSSIFYANLSFVYRGLLFITVGVTVFTTKYVMLKRRKI